MKIFNESGTEYRNDHGGNVMDIHEVICLNFQGNKGMCGTNDDGKCFTLNAMHGHDVHVVCMRKNE